MGTRNNSIHLGGGGVTWGQNIYLFLTQFILQKNERGRICGLTDGGTWKN